MDCQRILRYDIRSVVKTSRRQNGEKRGQRRSKNVSSWARFLLVVATICGVAYCAAYAFGISPAYCMFTRNYADLAPCYKYDLRRVNADVLLVGDSSLLYGIRPSIVQQASQISTYNYGLVGPAISFDPQAVIDHYLATNARPRAIVLYISPWNQFELHRITDPQWFPLAALILRHGSWVDFFRLFLARPSAIVEIPPTIVRSTGFSSGPVRRRRDEMERDGGHFDYSATLTRDNFALSDDCKASTRTSALRYAADNRELASLRSHYAMLGIPLYIYVAPVAICDDRLDDVKSAYDGVSDNRPVALSNKYFANDSPSARHSHVNADGVQPVSQLLADFLSQQKLIEPTGASAR
jgi:hypothetical protein